MKKRVLFCAALFAVTSIATEGTYTVIEDDNLWNLSGEFLGDPTEWESIWSQNQQIYNPDLIYPGDSIYIPGAGSNYQQVDNSQTFAQSVSSLGEVKNDDDVADVSENDATVSTVSPLQSYFNDQSNLYSVSTLRSAPYVIKSSETSGDIVIPGVGNINDDSRPLFGLNSIVKIKADAGHQFTEGEVYELSSSIKSMSHNDNDVEIILPSGAGVVTDVWGDSATIRITEAWSNITHGDRISNYRNISTLNSPKVDRSITPIEINSLTRLKDNVAIKPYETIILDGGSSSDIKIGDLFVAVIANEEGELDHEACFQGIVVNVDESTCALKIHGVYKLANGNEFKLKRFGRLVFE